MKKLQLKSIFLIATCFSLLVSCTATKTALYDQYSYQKTTAIRVEADAVMQKATTLYTANVAEVEALLLEAAKITEYEKNKPNNEITYAMWKVLTDKEKNLLAGFFKRWEQKEKFSPVFLEESKKQVLDALDLLIQYESKKDKKSEDGLLNLINLNK
jgi:hypothetical protein